MKLRNPMARLRARMAALRPPPASQLFDVAGVAGVGLVAFGTWEIYHPAGYIVLGGFLLAAAWLNGRTQG